VSLHQVKAAMVEKVAGKEAGAPAATAGCSKVLKRLKDRFC
jgi:hypothetical protein